MFCKTAIGAAVAGGVLACGAAVALEELRIQAGDDQAASLGGPVFLTGSVSKSASIGWSKVDGPGDVTFVQPHLAATEVSFSAPGEYTLMLGGFDGYLAYDMVRVTVGPYDTH